ncbi:MAG: hypothetical protein WC027_02020 [Candidatus Paceibacterota bacterium]
MPQVYAIIGKEAQRECTELEIDAFLERVGLCVSKRFDIVEEQDIATTVIHAARTKGEAQIQIEIRYTAGTDEYGKGIFDPSVEVQEALIDDIRRQFERHFKSLHRRVGRPSVWCKPYRGGAFHVDKF